MKKIDEFEKWPEIGSRAAAVKSCVSLLSAVCGQPADVMERWLDLYYQVRHAQEKADAAARAAEKKAMESFIIPGTLVGVDTRATASVAPTAKDEAADAGRPISVTAASGGDCSPRRGEPRAEEPSLLREKDLSKAEPSQAAAPEKPVKRPGGKGKPRPQAVGNTRGHDAAAFKRQVRDRLEVVRKKGVSAPELVKAAPAGSVKESDIYMILQGHVIKIDIYRAIDEALRHFEN